MCPDARPRSTTRPHRGEFYRWHRQHWPAMDTNDVRGEAYRWLQHAHYDHPEKDKQPYVIAIVDGINFMGEKETQAVPSSPHRTSKATEST